MKKKETEYIPQFDFENESTPIHAKTKNAQIVKKNQFLWSMGFAFTAEWKKVIVPVLLR